MNPNLPNETVWSINFVLHEFAPAEVEQMTGLGRDLQRDWRRRGYLPRKEKTGARARYTIFAAAELYAMRMFADMGKGPLLSSPHATRMALSIVKTALVWRSRIWGASDPVAIFDAIPADGRTRTSNEQARLECPDIVKCIDNRDNEKVSWLVDQLFLAMGVRDHVRDVPQIIWWPTGEVEVGSYEPEKVHIADEGLLDQVDPKFDGPAGVIHVEAVAANLARRSLRPWLSVSASVNANETVNRPELGHNHGTVVVSIGKEAKAG